MNGSGLSSVQEFNTFLQAFLPSKHSVSAMIGKLQPRPFDFQTTVWPVSCASPCTPQVIDGG